MSRKNYYQIEVPIAAASITNGVCAHAGASFASPQSLTDFGVVGVSVQIAPPVNASLRFSLLFYTGTTGLSKGASPDSIAAANLEDAGVFNGGPIVRLGHDSADVWGSSQGAGRVYSTVLDTPAYIVPDAGLYKFQLAVQGNPANTTDLPLKVVLRLVTLN